MVGFLVQCTYLQSFFTLVRQFCTEVADFLKVNFQTRTIYVCVLRIVVLKYSFRVFYKIGTNQNLNVPE